MMAIPPGGAGASRRPFFRRSLVWLLLVWLAVLALLYLALRDTALSQIWAVLNHLSVGQLLILAALNFGILLVMALRWWVLLRSMGVQIPLFLLLSYRLTGFGVSYFTPGPQMGGEPVQVHLLHDRRRVALPAAITSVFLDRLIDLLANFTFLVLGVLTILLSGLVEGTAWRAVPVGLVGILLLPLAHLQALWAGKRPLSRLLDRAVQKWPVLQKAAGLARQSEDQIGLLCRTRLDALLGVVALSVLLWGAYLFEFWLTLRFLGVNASLVEAVSALTAGRLSLLLPLPGALGALEAAQSLATRLLGWGAGVGIALSLVIRARDVFLALLGLWLGGVAYRSFLAIRRSPLPDEESKNLV